MQQKESKNGKIQKLIIAPISDNFVSFSLRFLDIEHPQSSTTKHLASQRAFSKKKSEVFATKKTDFKDAKKFDEVETLTSFAFL